MEEIFKRLHVIGRQEVGLILGGVGKVPDGSPAREECAEANIPEAFGTSADGTLMRTLQEFSFYMDDGVPAPIEALDDKFRYFFWGGVSCPVCGERPDKQLAGSRDDVAPLA